MIQLEKINEKARRRRRSDPDFLQIPPLQKTKKRDKGGVSVAKGRDKFLTVKYFHCKDL